MLAAYTLGQVLWTTVIFLLWIGFLAVGIWLLVRLFRNTSFLTENRGLRILVKVVLVIFTVFVPVLGVIVLFGIWYTTRSRDAQLSETEELVEAPRPATPSADEALYRRPLPFPPRPESETEATESPPPFE